MSDSIPEPNAYACIEQVRKALIVSVYTSCNHPGLKLAAWFYSLDLTHRYQSPMHVYSGSMNGVTTTVAPEVLPQHDNHSPVNRDSHISYECPKFKLTQERALPLVRWYEEHQDHPYPSRQDKLHLCQSTQLTYTQVSVLNCHHP